MKRYEVQFLDGSTQVYEAKRLLFPEGIGDLKEIEEGVVVVNVTEVRSVRVLEEPKVNEQTLTEAMSRQPGATTSSAAKPK